MMLPLIRAIVLMLPLCGCAGVPVALQVIAGLASASTLAKNEANCSLVELDKCTWPHIFAPVLK
jgi:hypothetical protein